MSRTRTADRNRQMLAAFEAGRSIEQLGADYGLKDQRAREILTSEHNKRLVSLESFYLVLRNA